MATVNIDAYSEGHNEEQGNGVLAWGRCGEKGF